MDYCPVVIVGGGLAGLTAAVHLAERGLPPVVLEANANECGGRLVGGESIEVTGSYFRREHGVHAIWAHYRNLQAMLVRHGVRPFLTPAQEEAWFYKRRGRVYMAAIGSVIRHSWLPAPFHYLSLLGVPELLSLLEAQDWPALFRVWSGLLWALGVDPLGEVQPLPGVWLADVLRGWSPTWRALFIGLARNGLAARPEEIPLSGFIAFLRFYTLLRRDAWSFGYLPADGGSCLIAPLVHKIGQLGGEVFLGRRVTHLERSTEGWRVRWAATAAAGVMTTPAVILATDAANAAALWRASAPADAAATYWPRALSSGVARFWFARHPRPGSEAGIFSGEFTGHNFFWLHRIQDEYRRWHNRCGGSAIEVHLYGPPELLSKDAALLQALLLNDVYSAYPEVSGEIWQQTFQVNSPTHTLPSVGPGERHWGVAAPWPGLWCCGDWVRHPTPALFMERACVTGIAAANAVLERYGRPPWPLLDYLLPEAPAALIERAMRAGRRWLRRRRVPHAIGKNVP